MVRTPGSPEGQQQQTVPSELHQILTKAFDSSPTITSITDLSTSQTPQTFNASYKITLSTNTSYILKISPPPETRVLRHESNILESEADILRLLQQQQRTRERNEVPVAVATPTHGYRLRQRVANKTFINFGHQKLSSVNNVS